jgi:DNA gyrase inhibitor GyrI
MKTEVKIERLALQRVVSAHGFGAQPEDLAWQKMKAWAGPKGLLGGSERRMFGYNNPNPSAGSPNYGYEFNLTVDEAVQAEGDLKVGDLRVKQLSGGLYAVMPFRMGEGGDPNLDIPEAWKKLDAWVAENGYRHGEQQWLEEHTLDGQIMALFYPLAD